MAFPGPREPKPDPRAGSAFQGLEEASGDSVDAESDSSRSQCKGPRVAPAQAGWLLKESFVSRIQRDSDAEVQVPG